MKTLILFFSMIVSQFLFAGTGGGGVMMMSSIKDSASKIVYHMGEQDGVVRFAYAQFVNNNWEVQQIQMSKADLISEVTVANALENSKSSNDWTTIK